MPHEDVLTLVQELQSHNTSPEEIKKELLSKGYGLEDVMGAIARAQLPSIHPGQVASITPTVVRQTTRHHVSGIVLGSIVFVLCISVFGAALVGTYWYASRSLSESNGVLAQIVENASGTPALLPTEPLVAPPSGKSQLPAYTPTRPTSLPPSSALGSTQFIDSSAPPTVAVSTPTPTPSITQSIVQAITAPFVPTPAPTLTLSISGNPIPYAGNATLSWTSTDATSCTALQGWAGSEPTSGSQMFSGLVSNVSYGLTCTGAGGTVTQYAQAEVSLPIPGGGGGGTSPPPAPAPTPTPTPNVSPIAAGCAVPSGSGGNTFYVDPVNGNDSGDGSQAHPWKTLSTVLSTDVNTQQYAEPYTTSETPTAFNPSGTINPGDTIYLMSGNYGAISVRGLNSDFITVEAAPGQTPILTTLTVGGATKWKFEGLKIQSLKNGYNPLVALSYNGFTGPVNNIIFDHNSISSIDDSSSWSASDWSSYAANEGIASDEGSGARSSTCLTITNNQITNVDFGIALNIDNSLLANNTINNFAGDGVDYAANNILISHNLVENARHIDGNHPDGFQGQIGDVNSSDPNAGYQNITIDGNIVYRKTIPNLPFANGLQGIDAFDMNWTNVTVTNNVVVTDAYQGISFASVHGGLIANNTVIFDGCEGDTSFCSTTSWIQVASSTHQGTPSNNVILRNNIATNLLISSPAVTIDHNITSGNMSYVVSGVQEYYTTPGTYGNNNTISPNLNAGFVQFDTTNLLYNLHLLSSSPANGFGIADQAPSVDIEGTSRVAPIAAGAYTSSYPALSYGRSRNSLLASVYEALAGLWKSILSTIEAL